MTCLRTLLEFANYKLAIFAIPDKTEAKGKRENQLRASNKVKNERERDANM